jgi:hypothetical protein
MFHKFLLTSMPDFYNKYFQAAEFLEMTKEQVSNEITGNIQNPKHIAPAGMVNSAGVTLGVDVDNICHVDYAS